ncbi:hypothetical protein [Thermocrinis sp.]|jgi:O-antigen/teichoic acid export membrane protein|uniref:hypothetical protein n=1 Tax=Thermocrinis sp. TaxID=2024383 RepID=UPI003C0E6AF3
MEKQELSHILVILSGLLRAVGIACMIALIFLGARLRYIFLIALLTVGGIFTAVLSFLLGILSFTHAVIYEAIVILINVLVFFLRLQGKKEPSTTKALGNHKVRGVFYVHKAKPGVFRAEVR